MCGISENSRPLISLKRWRNNPSKVFKNIALLHKGHFAVDLREFRLTVGTQVLVPEAAHDLEITVIAAHHQDLLEGLRRLRQGIKLPGVHPRRDDEVTRAFGRAFDHIRCLDFEETEAVEEFPRFDAEAVTQHHVALERPAAQVEVAVFHPQLVLTVGFLFDEEWRHLGFVQDFDGCGHDFDVTCGDFGVFARAFGDDAGDFDDKFAAKGLGHFVEGRVVGMDIDLRDAVAVTDIDKVEVTVVTCFLDPSSEGDFLTDMCEAEFAAGM